MENQEIQDSQGFILNNDKLESPYLMAASFNGLIDFVGAEVNNGVLFWKFSPANKARELVGQLYTRTEPHIPAYTLFNAIETFWKQITEIKNGGMNYAKYK